MTKIIAFCGLAGAGKSTAARRLVEAHGYERRPFAGPLKAMLATLMEVQGASPEEIAAAIDGATKGEPSWFLSGASPREAMQTLGTEWGRALNPELWVNAWSGGAARHPRVVVDDLRFPNEAAAVRAWGGIVVRVERPGAVALSGAAAAHASEHQPIKPDRTIVNDGAVGALYEAIDRLG